MYFCYILHLCSVSISVLPFSLVGIGFDTKNTEPFLRISSRVTD